MTAGKKALQVINHFDHSIVNIYARNHSLFFILRAILIICARYKDNVFSLRVKPTTCIAHTVFGWSLPGPSWFHCHSRLHHNLSALTLLLYTALCTVVHKKRGTILLPTSLPVIDRFLKFFYQRTLRTICSNVLIIVIFHHTVIASLHYFVKYKCKKKLTILTNIQVNRKNTSFTAMLVWRVFSIYLNVC